MRIIIFNLTDGHIQKFQETHKDSRDKTRQGYKVSKRTHIKKTNKAKRTNGQVQGRPIKNTRLTPQEEGCEEETDTTAIHKKTRGKIKTSHVSVHKEKGRKFLHKLSKEKSCRNGLACRPLHKS